MTNTVIPSFRKSKFADRGKTAENAVQKFLSRWADGHSTREFNRLVDTKAAGRIIKSSPADFEYFALDGAAPTHGLIEVKETEHEYRLARSKVPQLPRLVKREKAGGRCFVLIFHSTTKVWRCISAAWLQAGGDKGSWNVGHHSAHETPEAALASVLFPL